MTAITVQRVDLGIVDGVHRYEVKDISGKVIGYDEVYPPQIDDTEPSRS